MRKRGWGTLLGPSGGAAPSSLLTSLVAYWKLEEASGTRVDATGRGNDLAPVNTPGNAVGRVNNGLQCVAASTQYLNRADNADLSTGDIDFTIACWCYFDTLVDATLMQKYDIAGNQREYLLFYNKTDHATNNRFSFVVSSNGTLITTIDANTFGAASATTWYFVVAWHDSVANTINIQINNGAVDSAAYAAGVFDSTGEFRIGAIKNGALSVYAMNGRIDEAGLWKRILTAGERTSLYNGGAGVTYPF